MAIVSKVLGHRSIKMTERIYAKWMPKTIVNEVNKVAIKSEDKDRFQKLVSLAVDIIRNTDSGNLAAFVDAYDEYFDWHEDQVQRDNLLTYGGAPGSQQNRNVLVGQITRTIKFGDYGLDEQQVNKLTQIVSELAIKQE